MFHFVVSDTSALVNPNLPSHEKSDNVSLPSENGAKIDIDHKDSRISAVPVVGSTHIEEKDEARTKVSAESSVSSSILSSQVVAAPGPAFAAEEPASCDTAGELLYKTVDQSLPTRTEPETRSDPQDPAANEVSKDFTKEMNPSPVLRESTVREDHVTEAVIVPESHKEAIIEKYVLQDAANASGE